MTEQNEPIGLVGGMFFEYYLFDPLTNFTSEDVVAIARFIDIAFESDDSIPEGTSRHFKDRVFVPEDDLTVDEYIDILAEMNITINSEEAFKQLPESMQEHFEETVFKPFADFGLEELKTFISKVVNLRLDTNQFEPLPKHIKRQFIVQSRSEAPYRWGSRRSG